VTAVLTPSPLAADVLAHLDAQLASARRLLAHILNQGVAIRARDVEGVLRTMTEVQGEMTGRDRLERDRSALLGRAGQALGVPAEAVTLDALTGLMDGGEAEAARAQSAELRGLLAELAREHGINRALMRQELAFLEHLTRLIGATDGAGYGPGAGGGRAAGPISHLRVVDLEA
jgi:hypothetical protein